MLTSNSKVLTLFVRSYDHLVTEAPSPAAATDLAATTCQSTAATSTTAPPPTTKVQGSLKPQLSVSDSA